MSRSQTITFRVDQAEKNRLIREAQTEGFANVSDLARARVLGDKAETPRTYSTVNGRVDDLDTRLANLEKQINNRHFGGKE